MEKKQLLYEGRAKRVYATGEPELLIAAYKDSRGTAAVPGRGAVNNRVSVCLMQMLEQEGVPTHFVEQLSDRETVIRRAHMIPLKIIVRNVAAGSLCTRIGLPEGTWLHSAILEYYYRTTALGDPMINRYHAFELELCTPEELAVIDRYAFRINDILKPFLRGLGVDLIDLKLEFGRLSDGSIVLADEITPDTCRLWDAETGEKLDRDRFRRDPGGAKDISEAILHRMTGGNFM